MKKEINIRDIARLSGVSIATVSHILNETGKASEPTRERVLAVIRETGYQREKHPSRSKGRTIGVVLPSIRFPQETFLGDNPYYGELVAGIEECAGKMGYDALLAFYDKSEELEAWLKEMRIGGLVFLGRHPEGAFEELALSALPITLVDPDGKHRDRFSSVGIDDRQGAYLATRHLLELGHRWIAFADSASHPQELQQPQDVHLRRQKGYKEALADCGVPFREELVFGDSLTPQGGHRIGKRILLDTRITAAFATADILALGLIRACYEERKKIPGDFSIVGFDNISASAFFTPSLTTVEQNARKKGDAAARLLIEQIEEGRHKQAIELPLQLIVRESTAPPSSTA